MELAMKQEGIRYYDVTEFKQERQTKRLFVELKNSETRCRAIQKINMTYKMVIDQLLHDSLYYQPVIEALNSDYDEQTTLVQRTFNIGQPAIENTMKLAKNLSNLKRSAQQEAVKIFETIDLNEKRVKAHPKTAKKLVRRDVSLIVD